MKTGRYKTSTRTLWHCMGLGFKGSGGWASVVFAYNSTNTRELLDKQNKMFKTTLKPAPLNPKAPTLDAESR